MNNYSFYIHNKTNVIYLKCRNELLNEDFYFPLNRYYAYLYPSKNELSKISLLEVAEKVSFEKLDDYWSEMLKHNFLVLTEKSRPKENYYNALMTDQAFLLDNNDFFDIAEDYREILIFSYNFKIASEILQQIREEL